MASRTTVCFALAATMLAIVSLCGWHHRPGPTSLPPALAADAGHVLAERSFAAFSETTDDDAAKAKQPEREHRPMSALRVSAPRVSAPQSDRPTLAAAAWVSHQPPRLLYAPSAARPISARPASAAMPSETHWQAVGYDQPGSGLAHHSITHHDAPNNGDADRDHSHQELRVRIVRVRPVLEPLSASAHVIRPPQVSANTPADAPADAPADPLANALADTLAEAPSAPPPSAATEPIATPPELAPLPSLPTSSLPDPPLDAAESTSVPPDPAPAFVALPPTPPDGEPDPPHALAAPLPQPPPWLQPPEATPEWTGSDQHQDQPASPLADTPPQQPLAPPWPAAPALPAPNAVPRKGLAIEAATRQALAAAERACMLCQKGLVATAAAELRQTLMQIAQALDSQEGSDTRRQALASALAALEDAEDPRLAASACQQMQAAVGDVPAASQVLQRLGQVQMLQAAAAVAPRQRCIARAILWQQMALAVDPANWQAANELGVLLASSGRWVEAREALLQSVRVHPHAAGWHNLAVVHAQLGEDDLARRAAYERQLLAGQTPARDQAALRRPQVRWVDPSTFAASGDPVPTALSSTSEPSRSTTRR